MYNFFQKNITALSRHTTCRLPDSLPAHITALTAQNGSVTVKYGDLLIHSAYDPVKEGRTLAKNVPVGSSVCLYGFGLGYHVEALLDKIGESGSLLVIELNPDLLASAMILRDLSALLSHERLRLVFGEQEPSVAEEISRLMAGQSPAETVVLFHSPSFKCIPKHFERIANALEILQMERRFPAIFGDLESSNYALNKETVIHSDGINAYRDAHANQPAILVSAGPSLDNVIPYLRRLEKHCVVACVDTSLPILAQEGISPQYVFSLDPQDETFSYFAENLDSRSKLMYTPTANAHVFHHYKGKKIVVFKEGHSLFKDETKLMNEKGTTKAGGSVSCLGIDCLIQMGCNPILLAGQDCGFSGNRIYSRHSRINANLLDLITMTSTLPLLNLNRMNQTKLVPIKDMTGQKMLTSQMMYSYLRNIEDLAVSHPETKIHNLRSQGAHIENVAPLGSIADIMKILQPF